MYRILLVDDHTITRRGARDILTAELPIQTIGEAQNAAVALELIRLQDWDLVLLDISMPRENGVGLLKKIRVSHPRLPVLVFSFHAADQHAHRVIRYGAQGYISKDSEPAELIEAVRIVLKGGIYAGQPVANFSLDRKEKQPRLEKLSEREYEVFRRIAAGKGASEIAEELGVSARTVSTYRRRMAAKMHLRTNAEIVQYAVRNDMFEGQ